MRSLGVAIVLSALELACGGEGTPNASVERTVTGDTTSVHNRAPLFADTAHLRVVRRIGKQEGPPEYTFGEIHAFTVGPDGSVFTAEVHGPLRQYDASGRFVRVVASQGAGPGEVGLVTGLAVSPDGRLAAADLENHRFSVYSPEGEFAFQWPASEGQPGYGRDGITVDTAGKVYVGINPVLQRDDAPLSFPRPVYAVLTPQGTLLDTLFAPERFTRRCNVQSRRWFSSGWFEDLRVFYQPKVKWAVTLFGALIVGCPADYRFDVIQPSGAVLRISREWIPIEASSEELENAKEVITLSRNFAGYRGAWKWRGPELPQSKPAYQRILPAEDGRLWVWPSQPSEPEEVSQRAKAMGAPDRVWREQITGAFDVFEAEGRFVGSVALPKSLPYTFTPANPDPYIRGDTLWAVTVDSMEVQYLTRFAVVWPSL